MHNHLNDVPALLAGGADDTAHSEVIFSTGFGAEAAEYFLKQFDKPEVCFPLIVTKWHDRDVQKAQASVFVALQAQCEIVSFAAFFSSAPSGFQRRLRLVKRNRIGEYPVPEHRDYPDLLR